MRVQVQHVTQRESGLIFMKIGELDGLEVHLAKLEDLVNLPIDFSWIP